MNAYTLTAVAASVSTAGVPVRLTSILQGTDFTQRIGRAIKLTAFRLNGQLIGGQTNSAVDEQRNVFRIALVEMNAGVAPAAATFNVESTIDPRYVPGLVKVWYDHLFSLVSPGRDSTGYMPACRAVSIPEIRLDKVISYTGTVASSESNTSFYAWFISDSIAVPNPGFENGSMQLQFTDA